MPEKTTKPTAPKAAKKAKADAPFKAEEGFARYGLLSNPFRDLVSEAVDDIQVYHVNLEVDELLHTIKEEVLAKENRAVVALTGPIGVGKTERLRLAQTEGKERGAFVVYFDVTAKTTWALKGIAKGMQDAATLGAFARALAPPKWYRDLQALQKLKDPKYDQRAAGRALAAALNENVPSFLLLNDVHFLGKSAELDAFLVTFQELLDAIKPGVLVMIGCYPKFLASIFEKHAALASRMNKVIALPHLTTEEAGLLLAKKMLARRVVEDLDPLFPFDLDSIAALNERAGGNPRKLLQLADHAIEYAVTHRSYRVDSDLVSALWEAEEGHPEERGPEDVDVDSADSAADS